MISRLFILSTLGVHVFGSGWSYDRCSETGPAKWAGVCSNADAQQQTPIDLCGAKPFPLPAGVPKVSGTGYDVSRKVNILNNGHTIQINVGEPAAILDFGSLSTIIGRGSNSSSNNKWKLAQMHLHWGREGKDDEGSEHFMQGKKFPLEAHFVHFNADYPDITAAIAGAGSRALLVVGYFFELGSTIDGEAALMTAIVDESLSARQTPVEMKASVTLSDVIDLTGDFYSYPGGLTTPMCNMIVTWAVFSTPKKITPASLFRLKKVTAHPATTAAQKFVTQNTAASSSSGTSSGTTEHVSDEPISKHGNFRPLQPIGARTVYYSKGATEACTGVPPDSVFTCTTSAAVALNAGGLCQLLGVAFSVLLLLLHV